MSDENDWTAEPLHLASVEVSFDGSHYSTTLEASENYALGRCRSVLFLRTHMQKVRERPHVRQPQPPALKLRGVLRLQPLRSASPRAAAVSWIALLVERATRLRNSPGRRRSNFPPSKYPCVLTHI